MLRVLLWKLGCEWAHLKRALSPRQHQRVYYFAFGANLSRDVLARRRIRVYDEVDYALKDAGLRFTQPGFYKDHGYASADAVDGEVVYGKIYQILARDAERMDYFEGVPYLRAHDKIVERDGGIEFYYYRTTRVVEGLKPTREYLDYLVDAYRQMPMVPSDYVEAISAIDVLETFDPQDEIGLLVENIGSWPNALQPLLIVYERWCLRVIELVWHRSLLQWMIRI